MILITGATGFVGGHLIRGLSKNGVPLRAIVRDPDKARALKDLGVEVMPGDIADISSLEYACSGVERVVHLVGIIQEAPGVTFEGVHVDGTRNLLSAAKKAGVGHFVYQSALGTRHGAKSQYHKTKWEAEEQVRASGIAYTILRPSLIYGPGDQFTIRLSEMMKLAPVIPVIGTGKSKVQPIYVDDVVKCIKKAVAGNAFVNEIYEIGGPDQLTYEEVTAAIAETMEIKRPKVHIPLLFMKPAAKVLEKVLPKPPVTTDQLIMLQENNVCSLKDIREAFGVKPISFRDGLSRYIGKKQ